ncbi:malonyl-ACP O-methyltransferase BioC [Legionella spiritensis]|uniref:Malonyl-[acyl-carrier protein] O-methyltransferase n=1 Tax=Legionella spiritensis TaxID=452 RepID=A0A0W0ZAG3_LEGSP|nr:malonyl-ACP O-methyltransferase BioC [Legionella spiritensis]KTD66109.1 biotin synthase [Legionella spiritensis]SNV44128.1 biotin synthase [Legionella spiritensis]
MNLNKEICKSFNQHAADYEQAALVQHEIGTRLFERLDYLRITPRYVLDLGCGTGVFTRLLKKKYPSAEIIGTDIAHAMLLQSRKKQGWRTKWPLVNADMARLPFATGLFDLVFANQVLHWSTSLSATFRELSRVMNAGGCLMFSTLGPDTFKELRQAWSLVDRHAHVNDFVDMHDIGDDLLAEQFLDPVVDMEVLTMRYSSLPQLLHSLKAQGVRNVNPSRNKGLTGKGSQDALAGAYQSLCTEEGKYPLTYEVVYGHAWKGEMRLTGQGSETFIPVSAIRR